MAEPFTSDVIVVTADASLGMGGLAMIAGGGLGDVLPRLRRQPDHRDPGRRRLGDGSTATLRPRDGDRTRGASRPGPSGSYPTTPGSPAGAITAAASDKATRFLQFCDPFGLPVIWLIDCPGYMVGRTAEADSLMRRASRVLVAGAAIRVPMIAVVLRRGCRRPRRRNRLPELDNNLVGGHNSLTPLDLHPNEFYVPESGPLERFDWRREVWTRA